MAEGFVVRRGFIEPPVPEYRLIADINVTANTTQIDFDNLNITKEDELRLVYTFVGSSSSFSGYRLFVNNETNPNNYWIQFLNGEGSSVFAGRVNTTSIADANNTRYVQGFADIKISNNERLTYTSGRLFRIGNDSNDIRNNNINGLGIFTVSSINLISVSASITNGIAVGSRLQLYKVVR